MVRKRAGAGGAARFKGWVEHPRRFLLHEQHFASGIGDGRGHHSLGRHRAGAERAQRIEPAFEPGSATSASAFADHLDRANVAFIDGHLESIPVKTLLRMQGSDADIYFNCGK
jgi:prepilin-type processing-associated H-X9-DG protein